jgi:N-acetylneuraminate synthase
MKTAWDALGSVSYGPQSSDRGHVLYRRSLYFTQDLCEGDVIGPDAIRSVRPGYGLAPKYLDKIVGRRAASNIKKNTPVRWDKVM